MSHGFNRTAYCHTQAARCAAAAANARASDVKEAYLNLEQAWLHLAPDLESRAISSASSLQACRGKAGKRRLRTVS
jgi:hypothetical protein